MNERTRRAILTQEGVRRLINTSLDYGKEVTDGILSNYMQKLHNSGYDQQYRKEVLLSVKNAFRKILAKHKSTDVSTFLGILVQSQTTNIYCQVFFRP